MRRPLSSFNRRRATSLRSRRRRFAAAAKVPIVGDYIEDILTERELEDLILQFYPDAVRGTLQFDPRVRSYSRDSRGHFFFNFSMEGSEGGSVVFDVTCEGDRIRVHQFINIDG